MTGSPISIAALEKAFALPPMKVPGRVAKAKLSDNVPTAGDRKLIDAKLVRLDWLAWINAESTGIPAGVIDGFAVPTINLMAARTRGPMPTRLAEIIHRAIPVPVILLHEDEDAATGAALSVAPKRAAEREAGRVVTTAVFDTGPLGQPDQTFVAELALTRLPDRHLAALYTGLIERVEALLAARAAGRPFRLPSGADELERWRTALASVKALETEIASLSAAIRKKSRLAAKVELGEKVRLAKNRLDEAQALLK
jgi:hypothetical protein